MSWVTRQHAVNSKICWYGCEWVGEKMHGLWSGGCMPNKTWWEVVDLNHRDTSHLKWHLTHTWARASNEAANQWRTEYNNHATYTQKRETTFILNMRYVIKQPFRAALSSKQKKISPIRDWRSTPTYCQLQSHVTQKLGQKSKFRADKF